MLDRVVGVTCAERCLEDELACLAGASHSIGGVVLGIFFFGGGTSGAIVARECQVHGEICRIQKCAKSELVRPPLDGGELKDSLK